MASQTHLEFNNHTKYSLTLLERLHNIPWPLFLVAALLGGIGVTMLFTVAPPTTMGQFGSWDPWALRHMQRLAMVLPLGILIALIDIRIWHRFAYAIFLISLLMLVLVQFLGTENNNAVRWIDLGFMQLQPSEIAQVALILALARYFHGISHAESRNPLRLVPPLALIGLPFLLIVTQPDLGTSLKLMVIGVSVMFVAGVRWWFFILIALAVAAIPISISYLGFDQLIEMGVLKAYQVERIMTLVDCQDIQDECYQIFNSLTAIGNGGLTGQGYGSGSQIQKDFLPEAQTDFILAAIAEETGFVGVLCFFAVQMTLGGMAMVIAYRSESQFGRLLGIGLMVNLFLYLFINAGMISGLLPVVGVPLPLVSHGGTAMLVATGIVGLLGSISIHRHVPIDRLAGERDILLDRR